MKKESKPRRGVAWERTEYPYPHQTNLEKIFQDKWNKENTPSPGTNRGLGTAQELFVVPQKYSDSFDGPNKDDHNFFTHFFEKEVMVYELTEREQRIILTVIQWFGTNCGFAFLNECLKEGGYTLRRADWDECWRAPYVDKGGTRFTIARANWVLRYQRKIQEIMEKVNVLLRRPFTGPTENMIGREKAPVREGQQRNVIYSKQSLKS